MFEGVQKMKSPTTKKPSKPVPGPRPSQKGSDWQPGPERMISRRGRKPVPGPRPYMFGRDDFPKETIDMSKMLTQAVGNYLEANPLQAAWAASVSSKFDEKTGKVMANLFLLVPNHADCLKTVQSNIDNSVGVHGYLARALLSPHPNPELNDQGYLLPLGLGAPKRLVEGSIIHHFKRDSDKTAQVTAESRWLSESDNMHGEEDLQLVDNSKMECATRTQDNIQVSAPEELNKLIQGFQVTPVYYTPKGEN